MMSSQEPVSSISMVPISEEANTSDLVSMNDAEPPDGLGLSRATMFKLTSTGLSFFFSGMNDGSLGALIPYLIRSYDISTDLVSIV